ncbi:hypothetical protein [Schauerella aestuarii]|uniref:hypothetical protein n=1 Tax=Schauerella aestuarii TaxID=2511204 RepID=UPI001369343A|nr:hypothetical protein [Achromobacter aestuarii]MYZ42542.1 hypothetical protein [Achromobacter aestuarii]
MEMPEKCERVDLFAKRYPLIFAKADLPWGLECGVGWDALLASMFDKIEPVLAVAPKSKFRPLQIKEKFGALRFYYEAKGFDKESQAKISAAVDEAETASQRTCEVCGQPGKIRRTNWIRTVCDSCADRIAANDVD